MALEGALQEQREQHQRQVQTMQEHFQQEQKEMEQQVAALATQLAEQQLQQEQRHHHLEQLTPLQERSTALNPQRQRAGKQTAEQRQKERASIER